MKVLWIFLIVAVIGLKYSTVSGAPLTKWFKTDNYTYYIEEQEKFSWQQSYQECQKKNMALITAKAYKEDELLQKYLTQSFSPKPEFWLNASENVDLNELLNNKLFANFLNIRLDGVSDPQIVKSDNTNNCVLTADGTAQACGTLHGFICYDNTTKSSAQNVQNIVLKFN